ncbi:sensor histidine kinase [Megasphaera elsdenii]|uniref:sensor histidine kinase n=1 Tax=Megasphaera elsdenii TaxID=907 RepID=UPI0009198CDE|nr:ATP-binding protein [Megasphaera elsdenii]SHJ88089.1 Histidine kinase-, DNA gyrase B-, and HSP90-like ATPase [Megasphaera elsdenii]
MDRQQFQRVLENIIGNSLKYKDQAVGHLTLTLTDSEEGSYLLSFADDGCGVDDSELPKLFESFYRTDKARTNVAKGSGLGLAVVQQIVQAMKGQIWAQATVPKGLTICITLPKGESINETHLDY